MTTITACEFIAMLEHAWVSGNGLSADQSGLAGMKRGSIPLKIPAGPRAVADDSSPPDKVLVVSDRLDLRDWKIPGSIILSGVRFSGRVDMRGVIIKGNVDITCCPFDEELQLDDADIRGFVDLREVTA